MLFTYFSYEGKGSDSLKVNAEVFIGRLSLSLIKFN